MEGERHAHSRQNQPAFLLGLWEERERMRRGRCNQGLRMVAVKTKRIFKRKVLEFCLGKYDWFPLQFWETHPSYTPSPHILPRGASLHRHQKIHKMGLCLKQCESQGFQTEHASRALEITEANRLAVSLGLSMGRRSV